MAFVAADTERGVLLWIREMGDSESRALAGTDGASYPFWSPDGQTVGFFADRKLKRVDAGGGAVLTICEAPFGKGGSWNRDGQIVFAPSYNSEIHVVDAGGGTPRPVTRFGQTGPEVSASTQRELVYHSHRFPSFLPDGNRFLFLARSDLALDTGRNKAAIGSVDGGDVQPVVDTPTQAEYADGHLLYLQDDVLLARPFDPDALEFTDEAKVVAQDVTRIPGAARAIFSAADNGSLLYMRGETRATIRMAWVDRSGGKLEDLPIEGTILGVTLSPDGKSLAAAMDGHLWVFNLERNTRRRVTFGNDPGVDPVWTPDGRSLLYRALGGQGLDIHQRAADGSGETVVILEMEGDQKPEAVSPDGRTLLLRHASPNGTFQLWLLDLGGDGSAEPWLDGPFNVEGAQFSPDGRHVAYRTDETGRDEIFVTSFPDRRVKVQISTEGGVEPRWSADGSELYFLSQLDALWSARIRLTDDGFEADRAEPLLELAVPTYENYDVRGDAFLVESEGAASASLLLRLIVNWPSIAP